MTLSDRERGAMQDDVAELLRALGLSDHARSASPHDVVQTVILPAIRALRKDLEHAQRNDRVQLTASSPVRTGQPPEREQPQQRQPTLSDVRDRKLAMLHTVALMAAQLEAGDRAVGTRRDGEGFPVTNIEPASYYVTRAVQITREVERQIGQL